MTGTERLYGSPLLAARTIKQQIREQLGFTVNIGISSNKLLAKIAGDFEKPDRVHTLFPEEIPEKLWPLPVRELFLVGRATEEKLRHLGTRTIGALAKSDPVAAAALSAQARPRPLALRQWPLRRRAAAGTAGKQGLWQLHDPACRCDGLSPGRTRPAPPVRDRRHPAAARWEGRRLCRGTDQDLSV